MQRVCVALLGTLVAVANAYADEPVLWIDVRTVDEYETGHLPGAVNIDFDQIADGIRALKTSPDRPIRLYCKTGRRSGVAKDTLESLGFTNVRNAGGIAGVLRRAGVAPAIGAGCGPAEC